MKNSIRRTATSIPAVAVLTLAMAGCWAVGPDHSPPETKAPTGWVGLSKEAGAQPSVASPKTANLTEWWRKFDDPRLTALVNEAVKSNLDLQLAAARLRQARAVKGIAVGGLWPSVDASADRLRQSSPPVGGVGPRLTQNSYQAGFDAVWEIDIFGGSRRSVESAGAGVQAAEEGLRDAYVTLAAEIALNYTQLRGFQQEIAIAQENLKAQEHTADIVRKRQVAGFVSALDVANAEAQVATTKSQVPILESSARQTIYALSVLLARAPADLVKDLSEAGAVPLAPPDVPVGLPSDLLRRRPDIRQAEAQLHSATAQIGVATADLFPKFSLTGSMNWQSNAAHGLFTDANRFWSFGPAASWNLFQGGSTVSNIHVQQALRDQAFFSYRKTVLTAFQEVENALIAFAKEQEHRKFLGESTAANRKAVDLATQLYTQGQTDFLSVLDAQRSLYASQDALVQSNRNVAADLISLYKALGGGWESEPPAPAPKGR